MKIHYFNGVNKDWLLLRQKYITATESASLFRLGNKSVAAIMEDKMADPQPIKNEFMLIGNIMEPSVIESFKLRMGIQAEPADPDRIVMLTDDDSRLSATPDGKVIVDDEFHLIECKTVGGFTVESAKNNFIKWKESPPLNYLLQVQTQLLVAGVDKAFIGGMSYFFPCPFIVYQVTRNDRVCELLKEYSLHFWDCFENDKIYKVPKKITEEVKEELLKSKELAYISHDISLDYTGQIW